MTEIKLIIPHNSADIGGKPLTYSGSVNIDWGDGTSLTLTSDNDGIGKTHTYNDSNEHIVTITGNITGIKGTFWNDTQRGDNLQAIIGEGITSIAQDAFFATNLVYVSIPSTVTLIGSQCFKYTYITTYDLHWTSNPVTYDSNKMPIRTGTVFNIPYGTTQLYVNANYPLANLVERAKCEGANTLNGALVCLGKNMAENLTAMGIPSSESEGLTTLANKITSIPYYDLDIDSDKDIIQTSEVADISAEISERGGLNVGGNTVYFYEKYTPSLSLTSDTQIIQSEEKANIKAKLSDSEDGSVIADERVDFYEVDDA